MTLQVGTVGWSWCRGVIGTSCQSATFTKSLWGSEVSLAAPGPQAHSAHSTLGLNFQKSDRASWKAMQVEIFTAVVWSHLFICDAIVHVRVRHSHQCHNSIRLDMGSTLSVRSSSSHGTGPYGFRDLVLTSQHSDHFRNEKNKWTGWGESLEGYW